MSTRLEERKIRLAVVFVAVFAGTDAAHGQTSGYTYTKIALPGATYTEVTGINEAGQMVGTYTDAAGISHAFTHDGTSHTTINFPTAAYNYAFGISPAGHVVGSHSYSAPIGPYHAFLLQGGTHIEFDFPGRETDGRAINAGGDVVGIYNAGFGTRDHGFVKRGETYTTIDFPGSTATYAFGIDDAGTITGTYVDVLGLLRGFRYVGGSFAIINYPGASETYVGGINNLNAIVGWSIQWGKTTGFVLSGASFRSVIVPFPGVTSTRPRAINDDGVIVGSYTSTECPAGCGFVARPTASAPALCNLTLAMTYSAGTLNMGFTLSTSTPTTWSTWLIVLNRVYPMWSVPIPVISPSYTINVPISSFPPSGNVVLLSTLSDTSGGALCADFAFVNTGGATP